MQMMAAYAAIANGGVLRPPHIVSSVDGKPVKSAPGKRILAESTTASVRKMLEAVIGTGGTAAGAAIPGYTTAGKTGTAEKAINGEYSKEKYVASFIGFAPAKNPKLLAAVIVDEPNGDIYGGQVAAPAWKRIMNLALSYKQIAPE
jgi:cell division protein FtsI/penicillin-binding protein 2